MNRLSQKLDDLGVNPRLMLLVMGFAGFIGHLELPLLQHDIAFGVIRQSDICQCDLKSLGSFKFDDLTGTVQDIPGVYRQLDGRKVSMEGFMVSSGGDDERLSKFAFVYDLFPQSRSGVQQKVFVFTRDHQTVEYMADEVRIFGTLHVKPDRESDTGKVVSIYTLDLDRIEPL